MKLNAGGSGKIILYKGARGRGKTLTMVKDGYQYRCDGYRVLSNFKCSYAEPITNEEIQQLSKDSKLFDCIIMIDEIQMFLDSRRSMKSGAITFSNFIQQIRKRNIFILCTTQFSNTIDLRLRQHLDIVAFPNFIDKYEICEVIYLDLTALEIATELEALGIEKRKDKAKIIFEANPIFKMYDTTEMIV